MPELPLTPERNRLYRITHIENVPWILQHGLHCRSSATVDPHFIAIGSPDLISKRNGHAVPSAPGGTLSDYVPFYFTPHSKMLYNIKTGWEGITKRPNEEIAIFVSSIDQLIASGVRYLITNGHAYMAETDYFTDKTGLASIDWALLRSRNFKNDPDDPGKSGRYQAEALAHHHVPITALLGIACYHQGSADAIQAEVTKLGLAIPVRAVPDYYFS